MKNQSAPEGKVQAGLINSKVLATANAVSKAGAVVLLPDAQRVVVLPAGVSLDDILVQGRDIVIQMADGRVYVIPDGAVFVPQIVVDGVAVPPLNLAALLNGAQPQPAAGATQSSGGNFADPAGPIQDAYKLGNLLPYTELSFPEVRTAELFTPVDRKPTAGTIAATLDDDALAGGNPGGTGDDSPDTSNVSGTLPGEGGDGALTFALSNLGAPSGFTYELSGANTLQIKQGGITVITVTVNPATGVYSITQNAPILHESGNNENNQAFTINYSVTDADGDVAVGSIGINVDDDSPTAALSTLAVPALVLDESAASTDTSGASLPAGRSSITANFAANFVAPAYGADGPGSTSYALLLNGSNVASGLYALDQSDTSASDGDGYGQGAQILLNLSGNTITGSSGGVDYFTISIDAATGVVTFTQLKNVWNPNAGSSAAALDDPATLTTALASDVRVQQTIIDRDGDSATATVNVGQNTFTIQDDGPTAALSTLAVPGLVLDESAASTDTSGASLPAGRSSITANFSANFVTPAYGTDGPGTTSYALLLNGSNVASGLYALDLGDTSASDGDGYGQGAQILLNLSGNTIRGSAGGVDYFTISIDAATGVVTFTQLKNVWNPNAGSSAAALDDPATLTTALASDVRVQQTITDRDGDSATATVNVGQNTFAIQDDGPTARNDVDSVLSGATSATGNVITGVDFSGGDANTSDGVADNRGTDSGVLTRIASNNVPANVDTTADGTGNFLVAGQYGTLTINQNGNYTYVRAANAGGGTEVFTYTLTDGDGDTTTATLTITIQDLLPTAGQVGASVDDDGLAGPPAGNPASTVDDLAVPNSDGDNNESTFGGTLVFTPGDAPPTLSFGPSVNGTVVAVGQENVTYNVVGNVLTAVITGGARNGTALFKVEITNTATGAYKVTLLDNVLHAQGPNNENAVDPTAAITYRVTDSDGDTANGTLTITFDDDAPTASALVGGSVVEGATVTGTLAFVQGADGASVTHINGTALTFGVDGYSQAIDIGDGLIKVKADGSYSFTADAAVVNPGSASGTFTVTDGDGDTATANINFTITDGNRPTAGQTAASVDDDGLAGPPAGNPASTVDDLAVPNGDGDNNESTFGGTLVFTPGGDLPPTLSFGPSVNGTVVAVGQENVTYNVVGNVLTAVITGGARNGTALFKVEITNTATGAYKVTLLDNVLHAQGPNNENAVDPTAAITYRVTDSDNSTADGTLTITFDDDAPTASALVGGSVVEGATVTGTLAFVQGADGASVTHINGTALTFGVDGYSQAIDIGDGLIKVKADGSYSFTADAAVVNPGSASGTFTVTDGDGDTATANINFTITDGNRPTAGQTAASVDDDGLAGPPAGNPASTVDDLAVPNGDGDNNESTFGGTLVFTPGGDLPPTLSFGPTVNGTVVAVGQENVTYNVVGNVLTAVITGGARNGTALFKVEITNTATGAYKVTLLDNVLHAQGPNNENAVDPTAAITYRVTDSDNSTADGTLTITFDDDAPTASALVGGSVVEGATVTGTLAFVQGADGASVTHINGTALTFGVDGYSQAIDIGDGLIKVKADGSYSFTADAAVVNPGSASGTFTVTDGDGDTATANINFTITDGNRPAGGAATAAVDDDGLAGPPAGNPASTVGDLATNNGADGNAGTTADNDLDGAASSEATFRGVLNFTPGGDTPVTVSFGTNTTGTVGLETVTYSVVGNVLTATVNAGSRNGTALFKVEILNTTTGEYRVTLLDNVLHAGGPNDEATDATASLNFTVTDSDGSPATATLAITFDDDAPSFFGTSVQSQQTDNNAATTPAVGTLHFAPGADGPGSAMTITANLTGIKVGGHSLLGVQSGNVYTAYVDANDNGTRDGGENTVAFTLTVNPANGTSGQYVFDLVTPLDPTVTDTPIGGSSSFGAGPTGYQILQSATSQDLCVVSGYHMGGTFNEANWLSTGSAGPASNYTSAGVNGSTAGWGIDNNNFNGTDEMFVWDFGSQATRDPDGAGSFVPPVQGPEVAGDPPEVQMPDISFATFDFIGYVTGDDIKYVVHFTDGSFVSGTIPNANLNSGPDWTYTAPGGKFIADIEMFTSGTGSGKVDLVSVGVQSSTLDQTIPFTLQLTDGDGDQTTTANFSVHVATGLVPFAPALPIVLDLNHDGAQFLSLAAGVAVDYLGNGQPLNTAWVDKNDGILAIDLNGNGKVDSGREFVFGGNGQTDLEGLAAKYDSNHDGVLDARDAEFAKFGVWQDANGNGVNDAGEFRTLTDLGITSIKLTSDGTSYVAANGDVTVHGETVFTWADGSQGEAADASFVVSNVATADGETVGSTLDMGALLASDSGAFAIALPSLGDGDASNKIVSGTADGSAQEASPLPVVQEALDHEAAHNFIDHLLDSLGANDGTKEVGATNSDGGSHAIIAMLAADVGSDTAMGAMAVNLTSTVDDLHALAHA